ncbi:MAG TPA: aminotransferase class I/II-fold pyridoxal phosphate-dependent enzyme [Bryobacteraceae bacterium]|nr:aminotransferase class I/II-fold pyridoxal phosphate-dependent enzyme [Bryobacteraceae bacterium]
MLEKETPRALEEALAALEHRFAALPDFPVSATEGTSAVMADVAARLGDNFPYFHPLYAGQMLKPPHPVARAAYALATWINPNNHALDGGRASSEMEREAVAQIAAMFGWREHLGHLAGGGTMANLEALWVAGRLHPHKKIVASAQSHYTHERISGVLQLPFAKVATDTRGRIDPSALECMLKAGDIGCVVATLGTTATGSVDPLPEILALRERYGFRLHADAAYGGYFGLADNLGPEARAAFDRISEADSIVIDPHKHGLQPYGCGCVLFRDPAVGALYRHDSPATYFSSRQPHLGEISLECSRPGASAVALWATMRLLPLVRGGVFAQGLSACRRAALAFHARLAADGRFIAPFEPQLDIVVWAPRNGSAQRIFDEAAKRNLHLALARLPGVFFGKTEEILALRSVLMKPEHEQWIGRIWEILDEATNA